MGKKGVDGKRGVDGEEGAEGGAEVVPLQLSGVAMGIIHATKVCCGTEMPLIPQHDEAHQLHRLHLGLHNVCVLVQHETRNHLTNLGRGAPRCHP